MKNLLTILLLVLYTTSTIGATVHVHYCMGKLVGYSLRHSDVDACDKCGMKETKQKKGCCNEEHKQIKVKDEHNKANANEYVAKVFFAPSFITHTRYVVYSEVLSNTVVTNNYHPPPLFIHNKRHIVYGVFLI